MCLCGLAILTLWLIWTDWQLGQLPILGLGLLIGVGLAGDPEVTSALVLFAVAGMCWHLGYCGSGDVYLLAACGLWVPLTLLPYFCILVGILIFLLIVFFQYKKSEQHGFPLAPPLLLALWAEEACKMFFS